ncbi:MAG: hypothetical protein ACYCS3_00860 [Acidithiobacillus sp.]
MNNNRIFHIIINSFSEALTLSIPVFIYLFFISIKIYSADFTKIALEMSLMSIIYYSDSILIAKKLNPGSLSIASNVLLVILIIFSSSLFTLELLSNGTHTAVHATTLVYKLSVGSNIDTQVANTVLIVNGFVTNLMLRIIVSYQGENPGG